MTKQRFVINTPDDIINLSRYVSKVDPDVTPLSHIVQPYFIQPFDIPCALCVTSHMDGRIVALVNKSLTNTGHVCGKKLGDKYGEALLAYNESLERPPAGRANSTGKEHGRIAAASVAQLVAERHRNQAKGGPL